MTQATREGENMVPYRDIVSAVQDLRTDVREEMKGIKAELQASLAAGLAALNLSVTQLADAHHAARLEQERRNGEFAGRDRLEELIGQVHGHSNKITALQIQSVRIDKLQQCLDELEGKIDQAEAQTTGLQIGALKGTLSYLILIAIALLSSGFGVFLGHVVK